MATVPKTPAAAPKAEMPAYMSEEATFEGHWLGDELVVQGRIDGDISLSGWLRIGRSGRVEGRVRTRSVEIDGSFAGEVRAQLIVFGETARAEGTFICERVIMKEGAVANGSFDQPPPEKIVAPPAPANEDKKAAKPIAGSPQPADAKPTGGSSPPAGGTGTPPPASTNGKQA
jgi:cytoskeletal protein CcmA (bactofilin family)